MKRVRYPAEFKAWVDHIVRKGAMLDFDGRGLVKGKKATLLIASGGVYTEGSPIRDRDIATQYLRLLLGIIGSVDVQGCYTDLADCPSTLPTKK